MCSFALLYCIKRNDRIRNKFAEITRIKGLSTDYYQVKIKKLQKKIKRIFFPVKKGFMSATNASSTNTSYITRNS